MIAKGVEKMSGQIIKTVLEDVTHKPSELYSNLMGCTKSLNNLPKKNSQLLKWPDSHGSDTSGLKL